jgi:hypothetical protein
LVIVPQRGIMQAQVIGRTAPMSPVRESVLTRPVGAAAVRTPPARVADRAVFAKTAPPAPRVSRVEGLRTTRPAAVRGPGAGVARPAMPPVRNDRPPAVQVPAARLAEPSRSAPPAQAQERKAEQPKPAAKKPAKKTEKKDKPKDIR